MLSWSTGATPHRNSSLHTQHSTICSNGAMWRLSTCIKKFVLLLCAAFYNHGTLAHAAAAACRIHLVQLWSGMPGGGRLTQFHVNVTAPLHNIAQCAPHQHTLRAHPTRTHSTARRNTALQRAQQPSGVAFHNHAAQRLTLQRQRAEPAGNNLFVCLFVWVCSFRFCCN
jgi:hypothetical protein